MIIKCVCFFEEHIQHFLFLFGFRCLWCHVFINSLSSCTTCVLVHQLLITSSTSFLKLCDCFDRKGGHYLPQLFLYTTFRPLALSKQTPSARNAQWFTHRSFLGGGITQSAKGETSLDIYNFPLFSTHYSSVTLVLNKPFILYAFVHMQITVCLVCLPSNSCDVNKILICLCLSPLSHFMWQELLLLL